MKWLLGVVPIACLRDDVCNSKEYRLVSGMRAWSCVICVYFWLFITVSAGRLLSPSVNANFSRQEFHPALLLSSSSHSLNLLSSSEDTIRGEEIQEKQVLYHLFRNGRNGNDFRKPSTSFMISLFNELQRRGSLTYKDSTGTTTDTIRSFSGQSSKNTKRIRPTVDFYIPLLPTHEKLRHAEIRFLRNSKNKTRSRKYKFRIDVKKGDKTIRRIALRGRSDPQLHHDVFDVTKIVSPWINSFHGNIILHVKLSKKFQSHTLAAVKNMSLQSTSLIVLYLEDNDFLTKMYASFATVDGANIQDTSTKTASKKKRASPYSFTPFVNSSSYLQETNSETNSTARGRRTIQNRQRRNRKYKKWSHKSSQKDNCQMYDFEVDFNIIGWDQWNILPSKFNARFCSGECSSPIDVQYKPTNHAVLQSLMRIKRPLKAPLPCCVPTKLHPISMLYFENDEIVVRHHEDMVASECGCR